MQTGKRLAIITPLLLASATSFAQPSGYMASLSRGTVTGSLEHSTDASVFQSASSLPSDYKFGARTTLLKKGLVQPPSTQALPCDIRWDRDVAVKLRDGVVIYTDVLRPANGDQKLPAIVAWSPYGKSIPQTRLPAGVPADAVSPFMKGEGPDPGFWVCHGYVVLNPDPRGVFKSGGDINLLNGQDARDGYDFIEWAGTQPWSNGKVAMHGTSFLAMSQWGIAALRPPHLAAIAPWNGLDDLYRDTLMWGGIPDLQFSRLVFSGLVGENRRDRPDLAVQKYPFSSSYWSDRSPRVSAITVPTYVTTDVITELHRQGSLDAFRRLGSKDKWLRIDGRQEWVDQYDPSNQADLLRFFDHYLKNVDNGWEKTPRVRVTVVDPGGRDRVNVPYAKWPIESTKYERLYLNASNGLMSTREPAASSVAAYDSTGAGGITFVHVFDRATQLTGYLKLRVWVEAKDADDLDIFAIVTKHDRNGKLLVPAEESAWQYAPLVPPPGASGRLRVSMRELDPGQSTADIPVLSMNRPQKVRPGQIVPVDIAILPVSQMYHAGEQLRLTIAGHSFMPVPNPSASAHLPPGMAPTSTVQTLNKGVDAVHTGGSYVSYLQIPVIPAE